jgi:hypothetical protein
MVLVIIYTLRPSSILKYFCQTLLHIKRGPWWVLTKDGHEIFNVVHTKPSEAVPKVRSNVRDGSHRARAIKNAIIDQSANAALNGTSENSGHVFFNKTTPKKITNKSHHHQLLLFFSSLQRTRPSLANLESEIHPMKRCMRSILASTSAGVPERSKVASSSIVFSPFFTMLASENSLADSIGVD